MQTSSRKSLLLSARFDGATGRRRPFWKGWRAVAAGAVLAILAGSGIAVAAASSADAHIPKIAVTCTGIHVKAEYYNSGGTNTITVTIDGVQQSDGTNTSPLNFSTFYEHTFPFADASKSHAYSASIHGWDGNGTWDLTNAGQSTPCAPPTVPSLTLPVCSAAGTLLDLTANLDGLDISHNFTIALSSPDGGTAVSATAFTPNASTYSYPFHSVAPGHNYTVTLVDTTTNLSATQSGLLVACPVDSGINVAATQCSAPGGTGGFGVTLSSLALGRGYAVNLLDATTNAVLQTKSVTGDASGTASLSFDVAASGKYKATVTDVLVGASSKKTSSPLEYLPCPKTPGAPEIDPSQCTTTSGSPNSTITFSASGLVPGRTYRVTIFNGTSNVFDSQPFVAASSTFAEQTLPFPPGTYTVTVVDTLLPGFVSSTTTTIIACPLLPDLNLTSTQCTVPGGTASIALSVTNFVAARSYTFAVTQNGVPVGVAVALVAPATLSWTPTVPALSGLPAGLVYRVIVTDTVVPTVMASGDVSLAVCPGNPGITVKASCNVLGLSTANVTVTQLIGGQNYAVTILKTSNSAIVSSQAVSGANPTAVLQFKNVPNGNTYTVNIANTANTLTASTTFALSKCDLPTLAFTGANPVGPAVAGIGFLQLGLMLLAVNLVVRRRRTA